MLTRSHKLAKSFPQDTNSFSQVSKLLPQGSKSLPEDMKSFPQVFILSSFDANMQVISLYMIPSLYRDHPSTSIPFKFTYVSILLVTLAILMVILLSNLPSDL